MSGSEPPPEDPFQPVREAYDQAVESWSKATEQFLASQGAADASREFMQRYVEVHASLRSATQAAAESIHFPTTEDIARLAELVINVERKVEEVAERTRAGDERLARIEARVDELARERGEHDHPGAA